MSDNPDTPTLPAVIRAQLAERLADMHVCMPGRVVSYVAATQECAVQPLLKVKRKDETGALVSETPPVIARVPVVFPGSGSYSITFPVEVGDTVLLVFSEASLDKWLVSDGIVDPNDPRRFALTDAIAIPGLRSFRNPITTPPTNALVVTGSDVRLGSKTASQAVALKSDLEAIKPAILAGIDGQIAALAPGIPATSAEITSLTNLRTQITSSWPVCAVKVKAE